MHAPPTGKPLPVPSPAAVFQTVADGAVLLHTQHEVYYGLNAVGVEVWRLLTESDDLADLCVRLGRQYPDVLPEQLRTDVTELLDALQTAGLVVKRPWPPA